MKSIINRYFQYCDTLYGSLYDNLDQKEKYRIMELIEIGNLNAGTYRQNSIIRHIYTAEV